KYVRKIVHAGCPKCEESIKWRMPFFDYKGSVCFMAAFKEHATFGFWKGKLLFGEEDKGATGHFGRLASIKDLPNEGVLIGYVRKATALNERGVKARRPKLEAKRKLVVPSDLKSALAKNVKARKTFEGFSYSHKKEYAEWITGAKRDETRKKRLKTTIQWLSQGKPQNWRYM
ncbi:MAG TPA: YdeI/OmpD-associated family protein, partial [Chthoniobacterales bacterium]|nr:YdeI/OmpD-associated family protein [Chthoniobacterales bacterium]